ncbi:MAG: hypothetical protein K6F40_01750 [Bacteroidales bacterium]|nr:hypothetical protein [Bacteroidales bacterium]
MIIVIVVIAVILLFVVGYYFSVNNHETALRKEAEAQEKAIASVHDTMWKVIWLAVSFIISIIFIFVLINF